MYDVEKSAIKSFIEKELPAKSYEIKELLGELYITSANKNVISDSFC
jgi:putative protein-disulfide isomerase